MKYVVLTLMLTFCACGSVRHNQTKYNHCQDRLALYKTYYTQACRSAELWKERADSLQKVIWKLECEKDSLRWLLRDFKFTEGVKKW